VVCEGLPHPHDHLVGVGGCGQGVGGPPVTHLRGGGVPC
jgi:hypothetical protein